MREFLGIESDDNENFPHVNKGADVLNFVADMYSTSPYRDGYIKDRAKQARHRCSLDMNYMI